MVFTGLYYKRVLQKKGACSMAIASMIVLPAADRAVPVAQTLSGIPGISVHSLTAKGEIIVLTEADSLDALSRLSRQLEAVPDVLGVFPAYVTTADEAESN